MDKQYINLFKPCSMLIGGGDLDDTPTVSHVVEFQGLQKGKSVGEKPFPMPAASLVLFADATVVNAGKWFQGSPDSWIESLELPESVKLSKLNILLSVQYTSSRSLVLHLNYHEMSASRSNPETIGPGLSETGVSVIHPWLAEEGQEVASLNLSSDGHVIVAVTADSTVYLLPFRSLLMDPDAVAFHPHEQSSPYRSLHDIAYTRMQQIAPEASMSQFPGSVCQPLAVCLPLASCLTGAPPAMSPRGVVTPLSNDLPTSSCLWTPSSSLLGSPTDVSTSSLAAAPTSGTTDPFAASCSGLHLFVAHASGRLTLVDLTPSVRDFVFTFFLGHSQPLLQLSLFGDPFHLETLGLLPENPDRIPTSLFVRATDAYWKLPLVLPATKSSPAHNILDATRAKVIAHFQSPEFAKGKPSGPKHVHPDLEPDHILVGHGSFQFHRDLRGGAKPFSLFSKGAPAPVAARSAATLLPLLPTLEAFAPRHLSDTPDSHHVSIQTSKKWGTLGTLIASRYLLPPHGPGRLVLFEPSLGAQAVCELVLPLASTLRTTLLTALTYSNLRSHLHHAADDTLLSPNLLSNTQTLQLYNSATLHTLPSSPLPPMEHANVRTLLPDACFVVWLDSVLVLVENPVLPHRDMEPTALLQEFQAQLAPITAEGAGASGNLHTTTAAHDNAMAGGSAGEIKGDKEGNAYCARVSIVSTNLSCRALGHLAFIEEYIAGGGHAEVGPLGKHVAPPLSTLTLPYESVLQNFVLPPNVVVLSVKKLGIPATSGTKQTVQGVYITTTAGSFFLTPEGLLRPLELVTDALEALVLSTLRESETSAGAHADTPAPVPRFTLASLDHLAFSLGVDIGQAKSQLLSRYSDALLKRTHPAPPSAPKSAPKDAVAAMDPQDGKVQVMDSNGALTDPTVTKILALLTLFKMPLYSICTVLYSVQQYHTLAQIALANLAWEHRRTYTKLNPLRHFSDGSFTNQSEEVLCGTPATELADLLLKSFAKSALPDDVLIAFLQSNTDFSLPLAATLLGQQHSLILLRILHTRIQETTAPHLTGALRCFSQLLPSLNTLPAAQFLGEHGYALSVLLAPQRVQSGPLEAQTRQFRLAYNDAPTVPLYFGVLRGILSPSMLLHLVSSPHKTRPLALVLAAPLLQEHLLDFPNKERELLYSSLFEEQVLERIVAMSRRLIDSSNEKKNIMSHQRHSGCDDGETRDDSDYLLTLASNLSIIRDDILRFYEFVVHFTLLCQPNVQIGSFLEIGLDPKEGEGTAELVISPYLDPSIPADALWTQLFKHLALDISRTPLSVLLMPIVSKSAWNLALQAILCLLPSFPVHSNMLLPVEFVKTLPNFQISLHQTIVSSLCLMHVDLYTAPFAAIHLSLLQPAGSFQLQTTHETWLATERYLSPTQKKCAMLLIFMAVILFKQSYRIDNDTTDGAGAVAQVMNDKEPLCETPKAMDEVETTQGAISRIDDQEEDKLMKQVDSDLNGFLETVPPDLLAECIFHPIPNLGMQKLQAMTEILNIRPSHLLAALSSVTQ